MHRALPTEAGKAKIVWDRQVVPRTRGRYRRPERQGQTITLPRSAIREVYPLRGGEMYLAKFDPPFRFMFFGTDEDVFITGVSKRAFQAFQAGGEEAFFGAMKPQVIKNLEAEGFGPAVRQGDIWACRYMPDWQNICRSKMLSCPAQEIGEPIIVSSRPLVGTRHLLKGELMIASVINKVTEKRRKRKHHLQISKKTYIFATGTVSAPDHKPLELRDGIYLLARSENLSEYDPFPIRGRD